MKVKRLGIEWGVVHIEAESIELSQDDASVTAYINESHELVINLPDDAVIKYGAKGFVATIPTT